MFGWNPFSWWFKKLKLDAKHVQPDENIRESVVHASDEGPENPWMLRSVGAWTGLGSFINSNAMKRDIQLAKELGLGRLDVIVNDHSGDRKERRFTTYNNTKIKEFCHRVVDANFHLHLMTWWMPHTDYIKEGGDQLRALVEQTGAQSVMLDAEEPWTQARKPLPWEVAAQATEDAFKEIKFGVTGIGYASKEKVGPLVRRAAYMSPQCYSTSSNKLDPVTACPQLVDRWRRLFGDRELVLGLAAYRQKGRSGYTKEKFMTTAFNAGEGTKPTDIVYWSLRHIRSSRSTAKTIKKLTTRATHRAAV